MSNYTTNLQLENPIPGDPAVKDVWGTSENTARDQLDQAITGILTKSVAGSADVTLTNNQGATSESLNKLMVFTGALTGDIYVFMPPSRNRFFKVINSTTGAFTLTIAIDGGGGTPAGDVVEVGQGLLVSLYSDGTNINADTPGAIGVAGGDLSGSYPNPTVVATHLASPLPIAQGGTASATAADARTAFGLGTAAVLDVGTGASQIVQLTGAAKYPAVDGSLITGLVAAQVSGVVVPGAETDFTKQQYFGRQTVTDGATISWNLSTAQVGIVTLGANRAMGAPSNQKAGAVYILFVNRSGAYTITSWDAAFKWSGGTAPSQTASTGKIDVFTFVSDGTSMYGTMVANF